MSTIHFARLGFIGLLWSLWIAPVQAVVQLDGLQLPVTSRDARVGSLPPLPEALTLVTAHPDWRASWTRFGTLHTLQQPGGFLATGLDPDPGHVEATARAWLKANGALFRLSAASIDALELVRSEPLNQSQAQVLLFRQMADGVAVAWEGRIKVGLVEGKLFWLASTSIGDIGNLATPVFSPAQAWSAAANEIMPQLGIAVPAPAALPTQGDWYLFDVPGFTGAQRVRRGIVGLPGAGAVPVFEANVLRNDVASGQAIAYTTYVDAVNGRTLVLQSRVEQLASGDAAHRVQPARTAASTTTTTAFSGDLTAAPPVCQGPYAVLATDNYASAAAAVAATNPANDVVLDMYFNNPCTGASVAHSDTGVGQEAVSYAPASGILPAGNYFAKVSMFGGAPLPPSTYNGSFTLNATAAPAPTSANAMWQHFNVSPDPTYADTDTRTLGCWFKTNPDGSPAPGCVEQYLDGSSHHIPWDYIGNAPSQTTRGNNANTVEGWNVQIGGGNAYQPPAKPDRNYSFPWANTWFKNSCNPTVINHAVGTGNDIDAAIANLNAFHNRLHDFAYQLGLRERTGVAQLSNYGQTEAAREQDEELGVAQAGALSGGFPAYGGRDNANQVTLQDGVQPISDMYLWQTIGGAAYAPCVDGDFDAQVFAHEYGHLVQGRLTDPDAGLSGQEGRSMGEGWSDMNAEMFLDEYGLSPDNAPNKYALGSYISGDIEKGIRNYAMNNNPLNLSDVGYDVSCEIGLTNTAGTCEAQGEVHSDAEPWVGMQLDVRAALIAKYDALGFSHTNAVLKRQCAEGRVSADRCPGQRRWSQLVHDGMILQPPSPTYIDARDAILAADVARAADAYENWTPNQSELWTAFSRRGFGENASSAGPADTDPVGGWQSPQGGNVAVHFDVLDETGAPVVAQVFVGQYEARATPAADTDPATTGLSDTIPMRAGSYDFVVRADGFGHTRLHADLSGSAQTISVRLPRNLASATSGATVTATNIGTGTSTGLTKVIDDRDGTAWTWAMDLSTVDTGAKVDVVKPSFTIAFAGGAKDITRVQVSGNIEITVGQTKFGRFTSIHQFALAACDAASADCSQDASYTTVYTSPNGAFPSAPFRPVVVDMLLREFRLPAPVHASHLRFITLQNKCSGTPAYQGYLGAPALKDADPANNTDCRVTNGTLKRKDAAVDVAEVEAFGSDPVLGNDRIFADGFQ